MVMRRRNTELIKSLKRDENDILDGPWRIVKFFSRTYSLNDLKENGYEGDEAKAKMLMTKVKLNFPSLGKVNSKGPQWVEVGDLIPLYGGILSKLFHSLPLFLCMSY